MAKEVRELQATPLQRSPSPCLHLWERKVGRGNLTEPPAVWFHLSYFSSELEHKLVQTPWGTQVSHLQIFFFFLEMVPLPGLATGDSFLEESGRVHINMRWGKEPYRRCF